jgi:phage tail sheath protein FI
MPVTTSYPGVYIEEIPSAVRTITGVPTSIAAFVGRAKRGPVDKATVINGFPDYERTFGGLDLNSAMSFSVQDFFRNGGGQAVIVRLFHADEDASPPGSPPGSPPVAPATATLSVDTLNLEAAYPGAWGNALKVKIDHADDPSLKDVAEQQGLTVDDLFNMTIEDDNTGAREVYLNVSVVPGPRRVDKVLENRSKLVVVDGALPSSRPNEKPPSSPPDEDGGYYTVEVDGVKASDGGKLDVNDYTGAGAKKGIYALKEADLFNLLCLPPDWDTTTNDSYPGNLLADAVKLCVDERAMLLIDPPSDWTETKIAEEAMRGKGNGTKLEITNINAAIYFPRLKKANPLRDNQLEEFVPCGVVAGIMARTDTQRGVWKAPAGIEATIRGVPELTVKLTDDENGQLNPLGLNCLRSFPIIGRVVWGARTARGADILASEWKYVPVRRLTLFIEESLFRGTQWVVFEPNDEPLWAQIRLNVGAFMHNLFRQGTFQGTTPREAYFVKCDKETTTQNDIDQGIVNIVVGFAPLKPAEFVIIKIQQIAGELEV